VNTTVDTARRAVGPVGALLPVTFTDMPSVDRQREAVGRLERAGYRTAWTNEVIGKDALVQLAVLLGGGLTGQHELEKRRMGQDAVGGPRMSRSGRVSSMRPSFS
jgi:hypothetical protein